MYRNTGKFADNSTYNYDPRLTWILSGLMVLFGGAMTALISYGLTAQHTSNENQAAKLEALTSNVAVLMSRPAAVSQDEFYREMAAISRRLDADEAAIRSIRK